MGVKFDSWISKSSQSPQDFDQLKELVWKSRNFHPIESLEYGDYGLRDVEATLVEAIKANKKIALYADYDVDGTMSCVSWIWFFKAIGYDNFFHYIPCRFKEGYGVNLDAIKHLIDERSADLIITMDTGITANEEAAYCRDHGVEFICTDHHKIQPEKMPDCLILNPKMHPDELYKELCGCGITFVLLRRLGQTFEVDNQTWTDLLALTGMATICDVVPLNPVNHQLAKAGVNALFRSRRPVLTKLLEAVKADTDLDEKDVGFRIGPRINAVGRLEHADKVINAFINESPEELIRYMGQCNDRRKQIQQHIYAEAKELALKYPDDPILFLGGDWHPGVVGIVASKIAEEFWRPVWLYNNSNEMCKGSARSILGFDVTQAMMESGDLFHKYGGHKAAGGFSFPVENEDKIRDSLKAFAENLRKETPDLWKSKVEYDFTIPPHLINMELTYQLDDMKPFGHEYEEPRFLANLPIKEVKFYNDKQTGEPKHTAVLVKTPFGSQKIMFFNAVCIDLVDKKQAEFLVTAGRNVFRGQQSLQLMGIDYSIN